MPSSPFRSFPCLEPLEARIAPALLIVGANLLGGGSNPATGESSSGGNAVTLIKVLSGEAIAWYDGTHITEISFAPNTRLDLTGDVTGDIVGNLTSSGRLSDADHNHANGEDGNVLLANNLLGLTTHQLGSERGDVQNIITGGSVSNVNVNGHLDGLYAGDGVFRAGSALLSNGAVHSDAGTVVNPVNPASATGFTFQNITATITSGASVQRLTVAIAENLQVFAGDGSPLGVPSSLAGVAGGSISNVHIVSSLVSAGASSSTPSYALLAGDGGSGKTGGAGGAVFNVVEDTSTSLVQIEGGRGGAGSAGPGGAGGAVHDLNLQGDSASYTVLGGHGGAGKPGGVGGSVVHTNFAGKKPNSGIIVAGDFNGDGLQDVLVVDANTGDMVISDAQNNGTSFTPQLQYRDGNGNNVIKIAGAGTTPSDAVAVDVNGDGFLDIVVAYKNSNSLVVYQNNGDGSFWSSAGQKFQTSAVALTYSPEHLTAGNFGGSAAPDVIVTETTGGKASGHLLLGDDNGGFTTNSQVIQFASSITDLVTAKSSGGDVAFAGGIGGELYGLTASGDVNSPLSLNNTGLTVAGGVSNLDVNSTGDTLVAVSAAGRLVNFYTIQSGASLSAFGSLDLKNISGQVVSAHFAVTGTGTTGDSLAVLSSAGSGSQFGLYNPQTGTTSASYALARQVLSTSALKNFTVAYDYNINSNPPVETSFGFAALGGSLNQFSYSVEVGSPVAYAIPFAGKKVTVSSGDGGDGLASFAGGAAGAVNGINVESTDISVTGGAGGTSFAGPGGAGGTISNPASFVLGTATLLPSLAADEHLTLVAGSGGTPQSTAPTASGGAGGSLMGLSLSLSTGNLDVHAGSGGFGQGGLGGSGGSASGLKVSSLDGGLTLHAGDGGDALSGNVHGGAGGAIASLTYTLSLSPTVESAESGYTVNLISGNGGNASQGTASAGGAISGVSLKLDPANTTKDAVSNGVSTDTHLDSTVRVAVTTGHGGTGLIGGAGGLLGKFTSTTFLDQITTKGDTTPNPVVLSLTAGDGGAGTAGNGGAGGSVLLTGSAPIQGISFYDADAPEAGQSPLVVTGGHGGAGSVRGGAGGSVAGLVVQNAPSSVPNTILSETQLAGATIIAGAGGTGGSSDGGAGGSISGLQVAPKFGALTVTAGAGASGGGKGGAGGSVTSSYLADVNADIAIAAGAGGAGVTVGGHGGALSGLTVNSPEIAADALFTLLAGRGGSASGTGGQGGAGGNISGLTQQKDVNSVINRIEAGSGGSGFSGKGGAGGSVSAVSVAGFLGDPLFGAFGSDSNPQGVFSGRGGAGRQTAGVSGSVTGVTARQIAAIAGAYDFSAHDFGIATVVSGIRADIIGYDVNQNGSFDSTGGGSASPSGAEPIDGFILAKAITAINGTALFKFNS